MWQVKCHRIKFIIIESAQHNASTLIIIAKGAKKGFFRSVRVFVLTRTICLSPYAMIFNLARISVTPYVHPKLLY